MLNQIVEEINKCVDNECFIAALALALTIPDICGKAEYSFLKNQTKKRYIKWYDTYIGNNEIPSNPYGADMPYSSGELIYSLRNLLLHQGTPNVDAAMIKEEQCKVDKFILTISDVHDGGISRVSYKTENEITERMLEVNIVNFCSKLCRVAKSYYAENQSKFDFFEYELKDMRNRYAGLFK